MVSPTPAGLDLSHPAQARRFCPQFERVSVGRDGETKGDSREPPPDYWTPSASKVSSRRSASASFPSA